VYKTAKLSIKKKKSLKSVTLVIRATVGVARSTVLHEISYLSVS